MEKITKETQQFKDWLARWDERIDKHFETQFHSMWLNGYWEGLEVTMGPKYLKVIRCSGKSKSVAAFINRENGDIMKAASWNAPAKHARGNIFDEMGGMGAITSDGCYINYMR